MRTFKNNMPSEFFLALAAQQVLLSAAYSCPGKLTTAQPPIFWLGNTLRCYRNSMRYSSIAVNLQKLGIYTHCGFAKSAIAGDYLTLYDF